MRCCAHLHVIYSLCFNFIRNDVWCHVCVEAAVTTSFPAKESPHATAHADCYAENAGSLKTDCCSRYLQEVGYTDTILDVKSQRVRALLGLAGDGGSKAGERTSTEPLVNGTDSTTKGLGNRG